MSTAGEEPTNNERKESLLNEEHEKELFITSKPSKYVQLLYRINDNPPWHTSIFLGFQHYLTMFGGTVAVPLLLAKFLCAANNSLVKSQLICTIFFVSGISTLLQCTIGVRLPIVQGSTFSFIPPTIAILNLPKWRCPAQKTSAKSSHGIPKTINSTAVPVSVRQLYTNVDNSSCWRNICLKNGSLFANPTEKQNQTEIADGTKIKEVQVLVNKNHTSDTDDVEFSECVDDPEIWKSRIREIQGAIAVASLVQIILGGTGVIGFLMRYIGPLTVTPAITLIGLSLFEVAAEEAAQHWGTSILTMLLVILFSQYMRKVQVPYPTYTRARGLHKRRVAIFELFPVLLAIAVVWILCVIFTVTDHYPPGHAARTDIRSSVLKEAPWFRIPYPGQWGTPTVSIAAVIGMFAGVLAGIVESVGDYYACARLSGAPPVPKHALNRGILIEGIGCVLAGVFGTTSGTTSYSQNIGAIGITRVGSRRVVVMGGLIMVILAVIGKFGALFATIPQPIIGGVFIIMLSMVAAVGLSNLQFVDLNSVRNLFILGFSLFLGLVVPMWIHQNQHVIDTGSPEFDQILFVQLDTSMWVGGVLGFILDNTLPGTYEERGILKWRECYEADDDDVAQVASIRTYDIPFVTSFLQRFSFVQYIPFLPYYKEGDGGSTGRDKDLNRNDQSPNEVIETHC